MPEYVAGSLLKYFLGNKKSAIDPELDALFKNSVGPSVSTSKKTLVETHGSSKGGSIPEETRGRNPKTSKRARKDGETLNVVPEISKKEIKSNKLSVEELYALRSSKKSAESLKKLPKGESTEESGLNHRILKKRKRSVEAAEIKSQKKAKADENVNVDGVSHTLNRKRIEKDENNERNDAEKSESNEGSDVSEESETDERSDVDEKNETEDEENETDEKNDVNEKNETEEKSDVNEESETDERNDVDEGTNQVNDGPTDSGDTQKFDDSERSQRTIFVGNLPVSVVEKKNHKNLKSYFSTCGQIESIRFRSIAFSELLPRRVAFINKKFHPSRDALNAYIVFKEKTSVQDALSKNGTVFMSKHLRVDSVTKPRNHDRRRSVFIGNLDFDAQDEALWNHFENCGEIVYTRIVRDGKTNVGKGIAYVQFKDRSSVELALKLNDTKIGTRNIRVSRCHKSSLGNRNQSASKGKVVKKSFEGTRAVKGTKTPKIRQRTRLWKDALKKNKKQDN